MTDPEPQPKSGSYGTTDSGPVPMMRREIDRLQKRVRELEADARRYLWLKKTAPIIIASVAYRHKAACKFDGVTQVDQCVDAAIKESEDETNRP